MIIAKRKYLVGYCSFVDSTLINVSKFNNSIKVNAKRYMRWTCTYDEGHFTTPEVVFFGLLFATISLALHKGDDQTPSSISDSQRTYTHDKSHITTPNENSLESCGFSLEIFRTWVFGYLQQFRTWFKILLNLSWIPVNFMGWTSLQITVYDIWHRSTPGWRTNTLFYTWLVTNMCALI